MSSKPTKPAKSGYDLIKEFKSRYGDDYLENVPDATDECWLVIQYRTFQTRWLRAICTTIESAELRKIGVQMLIDEGYGGCQIEDKVFVERVWLDHLYGMEMKF